MYAKATFQNTIAYELSALFSMPLSLGEEGNMQISERVFWNRSYAKYHNFGKNWPANLFRNLKAFTSVTTISIPI